MADVATSLDPLQVLGAERLRALIQVSHDVNSTVELDVLLPRVLERTVQVVEAEAGSLWFVDGDAIRCASAIGPAAQIVIGTEVPADGFVGSVIAKREAVLVEDARGDARFIWPGDGAAAFTARSVITVPLVSHGECLGALQVMNDIGGKDEFNEEDLAFVLALADDAAAALRNARMVQHERRARDLKALLEVSHELTSSFELERVLVSLVNLAVRAVPFERCAIALWSNDQLQVRAISGEATLDRKAAAVRALESFLLWATEHGPTLDVPDIGAAGDAVAVQIRSNFPAYLASSPVKGLLCITMRDAESDLGVLHFEFAAPDFLEEWNREAAQLLANEAALAIRNAQLYADVPFISWLEPLAQKRRALLALPRASLLRFGALALTLALALVLVRLPVRVTAQQTVLRAAVHQPVRAGVAGILESVLVTDGERVAPGQAVAVLRNDALLERLRAAEGDVRVAEAQLLAAEARGEAAAASLARVRVAQLRDVAALLRQEVQRLRVTTAAGGVVLTPRLHERTGGWREAGDEVLLIGEPDWIEAELQVAQHEIGGVRAGDRVRVRTSADPQVRFEGHVLGIAPLPEQHDGAPVYTVRARLDNRLGMLRPGMTARARVYTGTRPLGELALRRPWRWLRLHIWW